MLRNCYNCEITKNTGKYLIISKIDRNNFINNCRIEKKLIFNTI